MESNEKPICEFELNRGCIYGNAPDEDATGKKIYKQALLDDAVIEESETDRRNDDES